ncbi:MAG: hypothetical protein EOP02_25965, partial [Proteobacteria bacterium]
MKRGELIVIYRLLVTGQSGVHRSNPASPRGTGADAGMGRQWLAQPLWANIANLDPTLAEGRLSVPDRPIVPFIIRATVGWGRRARPS